MYIHVHPQGEYWAGQNWDLDHDGDDGPDGVGVMNVLHFFHFLGQRCQLELKIAYR